MVRDLGLMLIVLAWLVSGLLAQYYRYKKVATSVERQQTKWVVFGLTAALYGRIDIKDGQVVQSNFPDYPALKMVETPVIETHIVPSTAEPSGMGEVGVPPIAPAVAHAMAQLTGKPVRQLPMV